MERLGFKYSEELTEEVRGATTVETRAGQKNPKNETNWGPDGKPYNAQHIGLNVSFLKPTSRFQSFFDRENSNKKDFFLFSR